MLCDDVAATHAGTPLALDLAAAQRFALKTDATAAAARVSASRPSSLAAGLGLCKAPYPLSWIEWSIADELSTLGEPGHSGRSGALVRAGASLDVGEVDLVLWPGHSEAPELRRRAYSFDYRKGFSAGPAVWLETDGFGAYAAADRDAMRELFRRHPAAGGSGPPPLFVTSEALFVMSALMLLNSLNSVDISEVDLSRVNRARVKGRKSPYLVYRTVDLAFTKTQRHRAEAAGMTLAQCRAHLVRGHFKVRLTGVFWWMPHIRGDFAVGAVDKHYEVRE